MHVTTHWPSIFGLLFQGLGGILALGGFAYLGLALRHVRRGLPPPEDRGWRPPVTVMVPAHGDAPRLEECLRSICAQDYPAVQVVFGLHSADDAARPVIERVRAAFPALDTALVIDGRRIGANPKNANLANMLSACRHDILVMVDSDVLVPPGFLSTIVQPLADREVGGVTCLYSGVAQPGLASRLGALYHNDWFLPSVLVDLSRREMDICYGAAIATTRKALLAIGGFEAMADAVAQDFVFGFKLHRHGFRIRLAAGTVATVVDEPSLGRLVRHELRWNRAIRAVRPLEHALSVFTSPLAWLLILLPFTWPPLWAAGMIGLHLALRLMLHRSLRRRFSLPPAEPWLVPLRELVNAVVWLVALFGRTVHWDDTVLITGEGLSMKRVESGK